MPGELKPKDTRTFITATAQRVQSQGEIISRAVTTTGQKKMITWRKAPVSRPLISVSKLKRSGNKVQLDGDSPHIKGPGGDVTPIYEKNGIFVVDLWFYRPSCPRSGFIGR